VILPPGSYSPEATVTNPVNYFEIGSPDPEVAAAFYSGLFGWTVEPPSGPAPYSMVAGGAGGLWDTSASGGQSWAIFYVQVDDVQASIAEAERLGADVVHPFTDNGGIEFAHIIDPAGNRLGIWKPKS
jgi:uncharacterized protein